MPNAKILIAIGAATAFAALPACNSGQQQENQDENIAVDGAMPGGIPPGADVETLPADESSTAAASELQNGYDTPEGNETADLNSQ